MKANDFYNHWLTLNASCRDMYLSLTEQDLWSDASVVREYYHLKSKVDEAWLAYVASSTGVTKEEAALRINANMHSARD